MRFRFRDKTASEQNASRSKCRQIAGISPNAHTMRPLALLVRVIMDVRHNGYKSVF